MTSPPSMPLCKRVIIFEGPDGAGKTILASRYAELIDARYVHLGPFPNVRRDLARLYVDAMLPALEGYQDVVLDRCWLSEVPYGGFHRDGAQRIDVAQRRQIERLAWRCGAVVVRCCPSIEVTTANFEARRARGQELLSGIKTHRQVHRWYEAHLHGVTSLDVADLDYTKTYDLDALHRQVVQRSLPHPRYLPSAGNWAAEVAIVGEAFAELKDGDASYRWPFGSLVAGGFSRWFTDQLAKTPYGEDRLLWINVDAARLGLLNVLAGRKRIIALGREAGRIVRETVDPAEDQLIELPHPQFTKRFSYAQPHPIVELLRGDLS